ncbi:MAG: hypothetical protein JNM00_08675, partial [Flavobacteriales bacterium]|nr:hypothetical protein [Flavobacteriales bacterium]
GIGNINGGKGEGFQGGGVMNINFSDYHGTQAAGTMNVNIGTYKGVQLAGLLNVNIGHLDGVQVSTLLNIAGNVKGSQIGLVNLCDSIQGVPIGLLSFVANGYHKFEISTDDLYPVGVSLRSGVPEFYNIVTAGFDPVTLNDSVFWTFGYGIGSAPKLARNLYLNFDLTCNAVVKANVSDDLNLLNRFTLGLEWQIARGFGITAGATLNGYLRESDADPVVFRNQSPEMIYSHTFSNDLLLDSWLGWRFGIRFF